MKLMATLIAAALALPAQALEVRPLVKAGLDFGGETLATAEFEDGDTEEIKAGEGVYFGGGLTLINDGRDLELHLTAAYKFAVINADNGDIEWTRWPLEALAFYRFPQVRIGGGLVYHVNPKLEGDGVVRNIDVRFENALGAVVQVDWRITDAIALGGRLTWLDYKAKAPASGRVSADGIGLSFSMNF